MGLLIHGNYNSSHPLKVTTADRTVPGSSLPGGPEINGTTDYGIIGVIDVGGIPSFGMYLPNTNPQGSVGSFYIVDQTGLNYGIIFSTRATGPASIQLFGDRGSMSMAQSAIVESAQLTTTDATTQTLQSYAANQANKGFIATADIVVWRNATNAGAFKLVTTYRTDGAALVTKVGATSTVHSVADAGLGAVVAAMDTDGTNIRVRVTGVAATTYRWQSRLSLVAV